MIWVSNQTANFLLCTITRADEKRDQCWNDTCPPSRSQPSLHCVIVWRGEGMHGLSSNNMLLGDFSDTMRRCSVCRTGPPRIPNTDNVEMPVEGLITCSRDYGGFLESRTCLSRVHVTKQYYLLILPSSTHLFLTHSKEAYFYMQIYTGCLSGWRFSGKKKKKIDLLAK